MSPLECMLHEITGGCSEPRTVTTVGGLLPEDSSLCLFLCPEYVIEMELEGWEKASEVPST